MQGKKTKTKVKDLKTKKNPKGGAVPPTSTLKGSKIAPTQLS